ncbi:MAG: LysM peptidoglycan-binding domain-containing protein, partial [Chloroflexota bacterium]
MKRWRWLVLLATYFWLLAFVTAASADTTYTVRPGDTLSAIARTFGTTVQALAEANHILNPDLIYVGQVLTIPGAGGGSTPPPPTSGATYVVQPGDTLSRIALRYGVT